MKHAVLGAVWIAAFVSACASQGHRSTPNVIKDGPLLCGDAGVSTCQEAGYGACLRGFCDRVPSGPCEVGSCPMGYTCTNNLASGCDGCVHDTGCVSLPLCQELSTPEWECVETPRVPVDAAAGATEDGGR
jgi:hypothetical protein